MKHLTITAFALVSSLTCHAELTDPPAFSDNVEREAILKVTTAVADWQIANPSKHKDWDWTDAALWTGLIAHADSTGDVRYYNYLRDVAQDLDYQLGPRHGFGDDHCIGQLYSWLYLQDQKPKQLEHTREIMSQFAKRPHDEPLVWKNKIVLREWAWCDALYMSPPTLAMLYQCTGDDLYLNALDRLYKKTTDYLFDTEESLYWRDQSYFKKREANGEKMFWSRGNGWVFAGLPNLLSYIPEDHSNRAYYEDIFVKMAKRLKDLQLEDGSWRASLLDPESYPAPESSGTAFFTYGMLWGINQGILDRETYYPVAIKGWQRLVRNVHPNGMLGFVQPIGADPRKVTEDQTEVYGVGGFLQAGHELLKLVTLQDSKRATIKLTNPSHVNRIDNIVEMDWDGVKAKLAAATPENIAVRDTVSGDFRTIQILHTQDKPGTLLFTADLTPHESRAFELIALKGAQPAQQPSRLTARAVPERKDDFAWENDRAAFRLYGPALAVENARGGVDAWMKSVRYPIVDKWYKDGDYHSDKGEGMDAYNVGDSLGCGGLGYLDKDGKLVTSPVYDEARVIADGPLHLEFELTYPQVEVNGANVVETRRVSMRPGTNLFSVTSSFEVAGDGNGITPVAGLPLRDEEKPSFRTTHSFVTYWEPPMPDDQGTTGVAIATPNSESGITVQRAHDHLLVPLSKSLEKPVTWMAGAAWSKAGFPDAEAWELGVESQLHTSKIAPITIK